MKITLEKINERSDPYQLFLDAIKDKETSRRYKNLLHAFLKLILSQVYHDTLENIPENRKETHLQNSYELKHRPHLGHDV